MNCPRCGRKNPSNSYFCTNCGYEFNGYDYADSNKKKDTVLYVLLAVALVILIALLVYLFSDQLGLDFAHKSKQDVEPTQTVIETTENPTPTPTPTITPTPSPDPVNELYNAVDFYIDCYLADVNSGDYIAMYSAVQDGSALEKEQREFVTDNAKNNLEEQLVSHSNTAYQKINDTTYQVTSVETYEVWQNIDPVHQQVSQKCVYKVSKQSDGSWKLSELVKCDIVNRKVY